MRMSAAQAAACQTWWSGGSGPPLLDTGAYRSVRTPVAYITYMCAVHVRIERLNVAYDMISFSNVIYTRALKIPLERVKGREEALY